MGKGSCMKYKLLVLDIDGTLTNEKKEITRHTKQTILRMQKAGVKGVLASGRPAYGVVPTARELELEQYGGFILSYNGGRIVDCSTGRTIYEKTIPHKLMGGIYGQVHDLDAALMTYEGDRIITEKPQNPTFLRSCQRILIRPLPWNACACSWGLRGLKSQPAGTGLTTFP